MAFMVTGYGLRRARRKAAIALCCGFFIWLSFATAGRAAGLRLLVLGDSLAAGYGLAAPDAFQAKLAEALRRAGRDVTLVDAAVSGDTTAGGRARLAWALADGADAAIVELGGNDGLRGTNWFQADRIHPNPTGVPIVVAHVLPYVLQLLDATRR